MMKLIKGDCLQKMNDIDAKSVDLVVVDLPYGQTACEWDVKIDLVQMWSELKKVCKKNSVFCFFTTTKFGIDLINSNPKWFKYDLVWEKTMAVGFLSANKMPLRSHEMIYVFGNPSGGKKTYNVQMVKGGKPYDSGFRNTATTIYGLIDSVYQTKSENGDRHPKSVIKIANPNRNALHQTQKPLGILEFLIKSYSNEGETVLDFTMGSGSTGEACKNLNRNFIGIEKDDSIFEVAYNRLI